MIIHERIVAAAVKVGEEIFALPAPTRHRNALNLAFSHHGPVLPCFPEQGFLTSQGRFVDREKAKEIAQRGGQILAGRGNSQQLFSEDLW